MCFVVSGSGVNAMDSSRDLGIVEVDPDTLSVAMGGVDGSIAVDQDALAGTAGLPYTRASARLAASGGSMAGHWRATLHAAATTLPIVLADLFALALAGSIGLLVVRLLQTGPEDMLRLPTPLVLL